MCSMSQLIRAKDWDLVREFTQQLCPVVRFLLNSMHFIYSASKVNLRAQGSFSDGLSKIMMNSILSEKFLNSV